MPQVTRRAVLTAGILGVAAAALPAMPAAAQTLPERDALAALVGRSIRLRSGAGTVRATVVDVSGIAGAASDADAYSVIVRPDDALPDGIYRLSGAGVDRTSLFFANVDRGRAAGLQAIVNRSVP
jgi:hypothetical protein